MARRGPRRRASRRLDCDEAMMALLATSLVDRHGEHLNRGFRLSGSSGVWRKKDGSYSARFVYRLRDRAGGDLVITYGMIVTVAGAESGGGA